MTLITQKISGSETINELITSQRCDNTDTWLSVIQVFRPVAAMDIRLWKHVFNLQLNRRD